MLAAEVLHQTELALAVKVWLSELYMHAGLRAVPSSVRFCAGAHSATQPHQPPGVQGGRLLQSIPWVEAWLLALWRDC